MIDITIYIKPNGRKQVIQIAINQSDEIWFKENSANISMEDIGDQYAIYVDIGLRDEEGEPDEIILLSAHRKASECFSILRKMCEEAIKD